MFLAARRAFEPLPPVRLGLPASGASPGARTIPAENLFAIPANVDDEGTGDGVDGGWGVVRISLIEVLPSVFLSPSL